MKKFLMIVFLATFAARGVDGTLDTTFGPDGTGFLVTDFGGTSDKANGILIDSNDNILVCGGYTTLAAENDFALARYLPNGALDDSFNPNAALRPFLPGRIVTDLGSRVEDAKAIVIQSDGKIVAFGTCESPALVSSFGVARYLPSGALDVTFNSAGDIPGTRCDEVSAGAAIGQSVKIQPDGKIVGCALIAGIDAALIRYNEDGTLDTTFGSGGIVISDFGSTEFGTDLAILDDGKILLIGKSGVEILVARYTANGNLDTTFGTNGFTTTGIGSNIQGRAVLLQSNGKIVVAATKLALPQKFALVRYDVNGIIDTTFGTEGTGIVQTDFGGFFSEVHAAVQQPDGKIILVGEQKDTVPPTFAALARYSIDGVLDTSFGSDGTGLVISDEIPGNLNTLKAVALTSEGKIVVAGNTDSGATNDFIVARYTNDSLSSNVSEVAKLLRGKFRRKLN